MPSEWVFAGFGGQGVMFAGQLLAYAAMDSDLEVTWIPSYGPEMRGGTAHCFVVISDQPIGSPVVRHPQIALVFNNPSFEKYAPQVAAGGLLVYNESLVTTAMDRTDIDTLAVPASHLAEDVGSPRVMNMVMLGAALARRPVLPIQALEQALDAHMQGSKRDLYAINCRALETGAAFVQA
jgi:2-oxoglutarate ferredoxin oxidoreductase subunit gamma